MADCCGFVAYLQHIMTCHDLNSNILIFRKTIYRLAHILSFLRNVKILYGRLIPNTFPLVFYLIIQTFKNY